MSIRPVIRTNPRVADQIADAVTRRVLERAQQIAREDAAAMEVEVVKIVTDEYPMRSGDRHKANTTHLHNSFVGRVEQAPKGPRAILTIKPGVSAAKVAALEFGSGEKGGKGGKYPITPRNARVLFWNDPNFTPTGNDRGRPMREGRSQPGFAVPSVMHPGVAAGRFMQRARRRVADRRRRVSR